MVMGWNRKTTVRRTVIDGLSSSVEIQFAVWIDSILVVLRIELAIEVMLQGHPFEAFMLGHSGNFNGRANGTRSGTETGEVDREIHEKIRKLNRILDRHVRRNERGS